RKRHQVDIDRVQDQLDAHQDDDDIAPREHAHGPDQKQRRAQRQIVSGSDLHRQILFFAITTLPTTATSSSTLAISNGSRYSVNSEWATASVLPMAGVPGGSPISAILNASFPFHMK